MSVFFNLPFGSPLPGIFEGTNADAGILALSTATALGTQNNGIGMVMQMPATCTINAIGFRQAVTTTGTGQPANGYTGSLLNTVGTTGLPNNASVLGTGTFTPSGANDGHWVWVTIANTAVNAGDEVAAAIFRNAATDATNQITASASVTATKGGYPYTCTEAASTWSKIATVYPVMALQDTNGNVYGRPFTGTGLLIARTFGDTSEIGSGFNISAALGTSFTLAGVRVLMKTPTTDTAKTFIATLYSSPGSSPVRIAQATLITSHFSGSASTLREGVFMFNSQPTLNTGTEYCVVFATTTASDGTIYTLDTEAAGDMNAYSMQQQFFFTSRTASSYAGIGAGTATGNFTDLATRRVWMDLIPASETAPSGGGIVKMAGSGGGFAG